MILKIDNEIPIPKAITRPFFIMPTAREMKVGDSILMYEDTGRKNKQKASQKCSMMSKRLKQIYIWDITEEGIRIWRVK